MLGALPMLARVVIIVEVVLRLRFLITEELVIIAHFALFLRNFRGVLEIVYFGLSRHLEFQRMLLYGWITQGLIFNWPRRRACIIVMTFHTLNFCFASLCNKC